GTASVRRAWLPSLHPFQATEPPQFPGRFSGPREELGGLLAWWLDTIGDVARSSRKRGGSTTSRPVVPPPPSPSLSASQLAALAALGEERTAKVGDVLYRVGDRRYPFIAIVEGEVAILDVAGQEILRHGPSGF